MLRVIFICAISSCLVALIASVCNCGKGCDRYPLEKCSNCTKGLHGSYCQKKNVALQGNASQQGTYSTANASRAVDGNTNNDYNKGSCSHSDERNNSWWSVQLGDNGVNQIRYMKIYNRKEAKENVWRRKGMEILIDGKRCKKWPDNVIPNITENVTCNETLTGHNLTITVIGQFFSLCEVQVFVCSDGWYGKDCGKRCNCRYQNESCDKVTGRCQWGCRAGYNGSDCETPCRNGTYGHNCSEECGHCANNKPCNKTNGHCQSCADGWDGEKCDECRHGRYGQDCTIDCGHCANNETCNNNTGHCPSCADGWSREKCNVCSDGRYEPNCDPCGHCVNNQTCNKTTGHCPAGACEEGWEGEKCVVRTRISTSLLSGDKLPVVIAVVVLLFVLLAVALLVIWFKRRREQTPSSGVNKTNQVNPELDAEKQNEEAENDEQENHDDDEVYAVETYVDDTYANATTCTDFVPSKVSLDKLQQYNQQMTAKKGFKIEYKLIPYGINGIVDTGKLPENKTKNRFAALYPYDHSRVVLDGPSDYINASYIAGWTGEGKYIASQGPTPVTISDLWRMVWQKDVDKIVMVTNLREMNKRKCEQYWPNENEQKVYGEITVMNTATISRANFNVTSLAFWKEKTQESRRLTHFHFTAWPDHDVPSAPALVTFWKKVKQLDSGGTRPLVVHCSAGVGRTGTFIALDYLMEQAKNTGKVCVYQCVAKQREARMNMVQTANQYEFVHHAVLEALQCPNTFYTIKEFTETFGAGKSYTSKQDDAIKKEFKNLQALRRDISEEEASDALLPDNRNKNKDRRVLPANTSRPFLTTVGPGSNNYINAVCLPTYQERSKMIVTQTPMTSTVCDFWSLVYDQDCSTVVCLDDAMDGVYPGEGRPLKTGAFCIEQTGMRYENSFTVKKFKLQNIERNDPPGTITLLHFTKLKESRNVASYLEFVRKVDELLSETEEKVLIHCSDGATQCGLFCSVLNTVIRLRLDSELDIYLTVRELQLVRLDFVNTLAQYKFCYDIVKEFIRSDSIYANT